MAEVGVGAVSVRDVERALLGPNGDGGAAYEISATRRAGDLKPDDITPGLTRIYERGSAAMAAAMRGYIGAAFGFALKSANDYRNPGAAKDWGITSNPILAIPSDQLARKAGDRHLAPAEFRAFWKWLETRDSVSQAAPVARILMATGQRVSEIMRIDDPSYDRVERFIDWARTKSGWKTADGNRRIHPADRGATFRGA